LKILITGAGGLVGRALTEHCQKLGDEVFDYDHKSLDIADAGAVQAAILAQRPDAVINCAAWTNVDGCEGDPVKTWRVNSVGPVNLAHASRDVDAVFVTISTDYVFDGSKSEGFYTQRDNPNPINVYGQFKLDGERRVQAEHARSIIVRAGYIFGLGGKNFLSTIVPDIRAGEKRKAIGDVFGTPTYGRDLAARLRELAVKDLPGVYHVVNSGDGASFETFAREALAVAQLSFDSIEVVSMDSFPRPAPRPRNTRLKCLVSPAVGLVPLRPWQEAVADFVAELSQ
jgi:dTDP-4-dehydrorhamnose reductase